MSDENQEFDKYGRKIRKGSPLGFLSSMARGGKELPTDKPAVAQSSNEEQVEADAAPEFDKYGRKIRKGASLPLLPTVVAIAFVGGITAVVLNENQSGTSDSPKTEVTKKFGESDTEGHNNTSITRDASYQAFGFSFTDELNGINWDNGARITFSNPRRCAYTIREEGWIECYFDTTEVGHLGKRKCAGVHAYRQGRYGYQYVNQTLDGYGGYRTVSTAECSQWS